MYGFCMALLEGGPRCFAGNKNIFTEAHFQGYTAYQSLNEDLKTLTQGRIHYFKTTVSRFQKFQREEPTHAEHLDQISSETFNVFLSGANFWSKSTDFGGSEFQSC